MDGSVMLIVYKNDSANAYGHEEPKYSSSIDCKLLSGRANGQATLSKKNGSSTSSDSPHFSVNVHCTNLPSLGHSSGKMSLVNPRQHFLYALGPKSSSKETLSSTSTSASIKEHSDYGTFWMDMKKATSASSASSDSDGGAAVPSDDALLATTNAEGSDGAAESDGGSGETLRAVHAAFMLFAFVIIFPLGAVLLRYLFSGVKVHGSLQTIGVIFTVVGGGLGIALSFDLSGENHDNVWYGVVAAVVFVTVVGLLGWKAWKSRNDGKGIDANGVGMMALGDAEATK
ncbi:CBD9-like protein [Stemphylium lycopersici]|nr:hypothetical protein TW65_08822 [Stemphylium lycopersici]RAR12051.1 CBD9-like protein [Stemphylium lycopersici]